MKFWPKNRTIQRHSFTIIPISIWRPELDFENSDYTIISRWEANFQNTSQLRFQMFNRYIKLYDDFDPTRTDDAIPLPADENYYYTSFEASFRSDQRKKYLIELTIL